MSATFFIKPARDNVMVRDPVTRKPLADAGELKPRNSYWHRRLRDGDVIETADKKNMLKAVPTKPKMDGDK
jgi:hypothetical protein